MRTFLPGAGGVISSALASVAVPASAALPIAPTAPFRRVRRLNSAYSVASCASPRSRVMSSKKLMHSSLFA